MDNPFKNLFKKQSGSVIGIDIGSSAIKVVQIKKSANKAVLETYGELALGPYGGVEIGQATNLPIEKVVEAVSDLMREKEVNISTNKCGIAMPFASSLMSLIEMPMLPYKQLASMIPLEARKYIPVPISEVTLDWSIIPREEMKVESEDENEERQAIKKIERTDVLLVAIHNDTITRFQEIITKTGLDCNFFEIEIFSTMRAVLDQTQNPVMIFDMGAASTKLYVVERGVVRVSHTINRGSQDVTSTISKSLGISMKDAEILKRGSGAIHGTTTDIREIVNLSLAYIFSEANQVILNYQKKYNKTLSKIILVGGGSSLRGIQSLAQANFQIEVVAGDPFKKIDAPAFLEDVLKETGPEFAVAVGVALRRLQETD